MPTLMEDQAAQRQMRLRVGHDNLTIFKPKGESTHLAYLKALVYAMYQNGYDLEIDPRSNEKYKPHVASHDLTGELTFWARCGGADIDELAYVLKHTDAQEVVLAVEADQLSMDSFITRLKRQIHYRYTTGRLRILVFQPLDRWFNPDAIDLDDENYELIKF